MCEYNNNYKKKNILFYLLCDTDWCVNMCFIFSLSPQAPLYSVRWYFESEEFYRYVPKESPPSIVFPVSGITVDVSISFYLVIRFVLFWFVFFSYNIGACNLVLVFARLFPNGSGNWCKFSTKHNQHTFYVNFIACSKAREKEKKTQKSSHYCSWHGIYAPFLSVVWAFFSLSLRFTYFSLSNSCCGCSLLLPKLWVFI